MSKVVTIPRTTPTTRTISKTSSQIEFFENTQQDYTLHLINHANLTYALFLKNAQIKLTIIAESPEVKGQIFAFIPAQASSYTSLQVETKLQSSHTSLKVHLIAIQTENTQIQMQGVIDIASGLEKASGHLLEEVILLGNAKYTSLQPILNVASPDVQASHGAKMHRVPLEKLFYMQSRGLSTDFALQMIIHSYGQQILQHFEGKEEEKKKVWNFIS